MNREKTINSGNCNTLDDSDGLINVHNLAYDLNQFTETISKEKECRLELEYSIKKISAVFESFLYHFITEMVKISVHNLHASRIKLSILQNKKCLIILYGDNGAGFNGDVDTLSASGNMKSLVEVLDSLKSCNGIYNLRSRLCEGILIEIVFDNVEVFK